jgi:hypothetical protein
MRSAKEENAPIADKAGWQDKKKIRRKKKKKNEKV